MCVHIYLVDTMIGQSGEGTSPLHISNCLHKHTTLPQEANNKAILREWYNNTTHKMCYTSLVQPPLKGLVTIACGSCVVKLCMMQPDEIFLTW